MGNGIPGTADFRGIIVCMQTSIGIVGFWGGLGQEGASRLISA